MTVNEAYGSIGAAKAFSSSVSNSASNKYNDREKKIESLEKLAKEQDEEGDTDGAKKTRKKIKRLKASNKLSNATKNSMDFLVKVMSYLDIGIELVIQWIAKFIEIYVPILEVAVKMLLLTNIKKMVSCAIDPRIPDEWRTNGIILNEAMIDPRRILEASPFDNRWGKYLYFDVFLDNKIVGNRDIGEIKKRESYELARAADMNAFLWFAKNKAKFVEPTEVPNASEVFKVDEDATLYNTSEFPEQEGENAQKFVGGCSFKINNSAPTIFLCEKVVNDEETQYKNVYTIVPATDNWTGITWYKDGTSLIKKKKREKIDYKKSKPLFNIQYLSDNNKKYLYPKGNLKFRILPKPFSTAGGFIVDMENNLYSMQQYIGSNEIHEVIGDEIVKNNYNFKFKGIQSPFPYEARFNNDGNYDKKGKYSIDTRNYLVIQSEEFTHPSENCVYYKILGAYGANPSAWLEFDKKYKSFDLVNWDENEGKVKSLDINERMVYLTECYGGKTVYEFNYDYVMSMQLFDAKSIVAGVVDYLMSFQLPTIPLIPKIPSIPNISFYGGDNNNDDDVIRNTEQARIDSYVDKLVEKMIDNEEYEFTDCFYNFDNQDYESMERSVMQNIANGTLVTDGTQNVVTEVYDIIDAYDADATLEKRTEIISSAIMKAAEACGFDNTSPGAVGEIGRRTSSEMPDTGGTSWLERFLKNAVNALVSAIVNSLLTPKVLMLLQVNRMMMGTYALPTRSDDVFENYKYNIEDVLDGLQDLLKNIIREIITTIQKEILRMILERLSDIMAAFIKKLGIEFAMKWVNIIKQIFSCISIPSRNRGSNGINNMGDYVNSIENILSRVDYADIESLKDEIIPNTNPC